MHQNTITGADEGATDSTIAARLRTTLFASIDYAINVLILFGFAAAGIVPLEVALQVLVFAILFNTIFLVMIVTRITQRFHDSSITALQVFAACGVNLLVLLLAPQIAYMAVINLFVLLSYGSLHFSQRTFLFAWFGLSCILGVELRLVSDVDMAMNSEAERWFFWAVVSIALGRFLAINAEVSRLRSRLHERNRDLGLMAGKLSDLASRDELTGLWNRREFMRRLNEERKRVERRGSNFCIAVIDADHFKRVNDRFGHITGDMVLQELARIFDRTRRTTDTLARYGGEEFILLLLDANTETAAQALERMRSAVENHDWTNIASGLEVTLSAGVAAWRMGEDIAQLINRADGALYEAKNTGRNRICVAHQLLSPP